MGRTVRLESNSTALFQGISGLFDSTAEYHAMPPDFLWRVVGEAGAGTQAPWPEMAAFSDDGLRYITLGQRSFFAIDLEAREAIAFLTDEWAGDRAGFSSVFAATLFDMTAPALGLVQIAAACVALRGRALLVFGPPRSGKTSAAYLAGKLGLEARSDQASFLDRQREGWQVWGQFWPPAFREESVQFLPELASTTRSFAYGNMTFLCLANNPFRATARRAAAPVGCVFLERRRVVVPRLVPLDSAEREERLSDCLAFQDDPRFNSQSAAALRALGALPAYRLRYGNDPAVAASFLRNILAVHNSLEVAR